MEKREPGLRSEETWGVKRGVLETFEHPRVHGGWIWYAEASEYRL